VKWRLLVLGLAVAVPLVPLPPRIIERYYSGGIFPPIQSIVTSASNRTSFAWFDLFVVFAVGVVLWRSARDLRTQRVPIAAARIALRIATVAAVVSLLFFAAWGLNYRREPLREKIPFEAGRITPDAARRLARETVTRLGALHDAAHAEGWPEPTEVSAALATSFQRTARSLGFPADVVLGRPKHSVLDLYFRRAGVAGMTDPFFLETLVASDLLPFERPVVVAHEWAHLAGVTDEGEANFVGWLTCVRGTSAHQYSGWLFLYSEVMATLPRDDGREISTPLTSGPRADLEAIRNRYEREVSPRLSAAGWQVYDQYLKANRIEAGTESYAEVIRLILATDYR
jgi:hypothetical protein